MLDFTFESLSSDEIKKLIEKPLNQIITRNSRETIFRPIVLQKFLIFGHLIFFAENRTFFGSTVSETLARF